MTRTVSSTSKLNSLHEPDCHQTLLSVVDCDCSHTLHLTPEIQTTLWPELQNCHSSPRPVSNRTTNKHGHSTGCLRKRKNRDSSPSGRPDTAYGPSESVLPREIVNIFIVLQELIGSGREGSNIIDCSIRQVPVRTPGLNSSLSASRQRVTPG